MSIESFTIIVLGLIWFTSSNICVMKLGAPVFGVHIFNTGLKCIYLKLLCLCVGLDAGMYL